ncbi:MAG: quinolinate synthase NadA [Thermodesulfobacteriota bacterium]
MKDLNEIRDEIKRLKADKNAVIIAHNYQVPEVQDISDFIGDSLALSQKAAETDADIIVFCGVHFMAETASIISPEKKVLIPDLEAGCSLADTINADQLRKWKEEYPGAVVVSYVNTTAEVKAESDYCCTSANAVNVVKSIPEDKEILFLPDMFLAAYVARKTGRKIQIWPGECHVHAGIRPKDIVEIRDKHPDAEMIIHPECGCTTSLMCYADDTTNGDNGIKILSTGGMVKRALESDSDKFIIGTETGLLYRLRKENPGKEFIPVKEDAVCEFMKMITLEKVLESLRNEVYEVKVPEDTAIKAKKAIDRMLEITH